MDNLVEFINIVTPGIFLVFAMHILLAFGAVYVRQHKGIHKQLRGQLLEGVLAVIVMVGFLQYNYIVTRANETDLLGVSGLFTSEEAISNDQPGSFEPDNTSFTFEDSFESAVEEANDAIKAQINLALEQEAEVDESTESEPNYGVDEPEANIDLAEEDYYFEDYFERGNSSSLDIGWNDCSDDQSQHYSTLSIFDNGVAAEQLSDSGGNLVGGRNGISCAWQETNTTDVEVSVKWSGGYYSDGSVNTTTTASPLLFYDAEATRKGVGAWIGELYGTPVVFVAYLVDEFREETLISAGLVPGGHQDGVERNVKIVYEGDSTITVWVDNIQVTMLNDIGLGPIDIDSSITQRTKHGISVNSSKVSPAENMNTTKGVESMFIKETSI